MEPNKPSVSPSARDRELERGGERPEPDDDALDPLSWQALCATLPDLEDVAADLPSFEDMAEQIGDLEAWTRL